MADRTTNDEVTLEKTAMKLNGFQAAAAEQTRFGCENASNRSFSENDNDSIGNEKDKSFPQNCLSANATHSMAPTHHQHCVQQEERRSKEGHSPNSQLPSELANVTVVRSLDMDVPATFPEKLMKILSSSEHSDIITWLPHGRGFIFLQKRRFASDILPRYFRQTKFTSFTRKLNRWGFQRVRRGPEAGAYYHELFQRDRPGLCMRMNCYSGVKTPPAFSTGDVAESPHGAASFAGMIHPMAGVNVSMHNSGLGSRPSAFSIASNQAQVPSMQMQEQMQFHNVKSQRNMPLQQHYQEQEIQQMNQSVEKASSMAVNQVQLQQQLMQLHALTRAEAETDAIQQAMSVPSPSSGNNDIITPSQIRSSSSFGLQQHSIPPALPPTTMGGTMNENMSNPSPSLPAQLQALHDRQAAQIEALRQKASGNGIGLEFDVFQVQQEMHNQQRQGSPRGSDVATRHKRYRASAA